MIEALLSVLVFALLLDWFLPRDYRDIPQREDGEDSDDIQT